MQKTRKCFDGEQEKSSIDRLPDKILVHILSFVSSTKQCVRSSILSKRWRFLWVRVPNLELDSRDHETVTSFSNFVHKFFFIHKGQNINTFRLVHNKDDKKFEFETLLAAAVACNVKVIDIHSRFDLVLPECLFTCKTLVDLTLYFICEERDSVPMLPMTGTTVYLPALKKLKLGRVRYESEESLVHLLSGCPALEELTIRKDVDKVVCLCVSSPTLTRLDLEVCDVSGNNDDGPFDVKLDTPALKYLRLHDSLPKDFLAGMLASLDEADIYFHYYDHTTMLGVPQNRSILEFVDKLNNVSYLKLRTGWINIPESRLMTTEFRNLTKLEYEGDVRLVTKFLERSVNLKVLIFCSMFNGFRDWMEPKKVPVCMKYHLETVRFVEFECTETEFDMVKYILRNARVLKRMEIDVFRDDVKTKYEALKRISLFERASEACQLAFD